MLKIDVQFVYSAAALLCALCGAGYDLKSRRVPNFLTLPAILFGLSLHIILGGWPQLKSSAAAGLICGLIFLVFYLAGGMGAGDVKLITAVGCIAGLSFIGELLILTSLAGGVMAIGLALYHRQFKNTCLNIYVLAIHHKTEGLAPHPEFNIGNAHTLRLPYALPIAIGSALCLCLKIVQG
jgi:prepilin peptidase CpaA